jgi:general stress protein 26
MTPANRALIDELLRTHGNLTLATVRADGYPQATTVAYANDGLTIYVGVGRDSQKAHNIARCKKVSLTIDDDAPDWNRIRGLSMGATAEIVTDVAELARAGDLMLRKFPRISDFPAEDLQNIAILRIVPTVISILDYTKGFGHTELVTV